MKGRVHLCTRCGWSFSNPHPSAKHRRSHKKHCGTIEGYTVLIGAEAISDEDHHADTDKEKSPSTNEVLDPNSIWTDKPDLDAPIVEKGLKENAPEETVLKSYSVLTEKNPFELLHQRRLSRHLIRLLKPLDPSRWPSPPSNEALKENAPEETVLKSAAAAQKKTKASDSMRLESIEAVNKIVEEANKLIQPTGTVELFGALKARLYDSNQNLIMHTMTSISGLASAMGPAIEKSSKGIDIVKCIGDNKKHMRESTGLNKWMASCLDNQSKRSLRASGCFGDIVRVCGAQMVMKNVSDIQGPALAIVLERLKSHGAFPEVHDNTRATGTGPTVKTTSKIGKSNLLSKQLAIWLLRPVDVAMTVIVDINPILLSINTLQLQS
nr:protein MOR1 [Tanacetum cinerariifolium]